METIMMCYYLLRSNKESGPFTLRELREMPLLTTDLIWINGESTCWQSPDEIPELQGLAKTAQNEPRAVKERPGSTTAVAVPVSYTATTRTSITPPSSQANGSREEDAVAEEPVPKPSFEELKKKYAARAPRKKVWKSQINIGANLIGIATLVIGVSTAAFMIKKAVENIESDPIVATAEAVEIGSGGMHLSSSSQAALAPIAAATAPAQALVIENTPAATNTPAEKEPEVKEPARPAVPAAVKPEEKKNVAVNDFQVMPAAEKEKVEPVEPVEAIQAPQKNDEPEEATEKKKKKPALQLSANEYKVGLLGGISNLELLVKNPDSQAISKTLVEVEYLKPNGKVVATQTVAVPGLAANSTKKISVPDNSRGVSVRYRVLDIED